MNGSTGFYDRTFRPRREPEASIYDAFQCEAASRPRRTWEESEEGEINAVLRTATTLAPKHGLRAPTREDADLARMQASGHVDFGAQWALNLVDRMRRPESLPLPGKMSQPV